MQEARLRSGHARHSNHIFTSDPEEALQLVTIVYARSEIVCLVTGVSAHHIDYGNELADQVRRNMPDVIIFALTGRPAGATSTAFDAIIARTDMGRKAIAEIVNCSWPKNVEQAAVESIWPEVEYRTPLQPTEAEFTSLSKATLSSVRVEPSH